MKAFLLGTLASAAFGVAAQGVDYKPLNLVVHTIRLRAPIIFSAPSDQGESIMDAWCTNMSYMYWSNSRHPGGDQDGRLNQHQDGLGMRCSMGAADPTIVGFDTMVNSQFGSTAAFSIGKQLDLLRLWGARAYVGVSATALSYEMPARHLTAYGVIPTRHRGLSYELPYQWGILGWEEQRLPQGVKLRGWSFQVIKPLNIF